MGVDRDDGDSYREHAEELVRFATGLVGPAAAQDVLADAVLRAMTSPAWPQVVDPRSYLYRSVVNEVRMHHRSAMAREARERRAAPPHRVDDPCVDPDVLRAVAELGVRQRSVVFLAFWEDLTAVEVAERLGVSLRTVRRDLESAKRTLKGLLDD